MAVFSSVNLSQIEYTRVDADFYRPQYLRELKSWKKIKESIGTAKLSQLISAPVRTGRTPHSRRIQAEDSVVSFIKTDNIREGTINFSTSASLPVRVLKDSDYINPDSLVVTIIGATPEIVGRAAIVRSSDPQCVTNQNIAVIATNDKCDPYFLTAYLQTKFGRDQLWRLSRRTEQVNLNCREVERILVPNPGINIQQNIGDLIRHSFRETDNSVSLYTQAKQLLESELGLDKICFQKPAGYKARFNTVRLTDTFSAQRIDSQCFAPDALFYEKWLCSHFRCNRLGKLLQSSAKGCQQTESPKGNCDYCSIKHILGREMVGVSKCRLSADTAVAGTDDLLLAITGATIGKIGIVKRYTRLAFSGDLLMLRTKSEINPNYLLLALDHRIGQMQFFRWITGSTNGHLSPRDIGRVLVPRLDESIEDNISQLVEKSLYKRQESEQLLEQAKSRVERLIEEGVR